MNIKIAVVSVLALASMTVACNKYAEGPNFSLKSKSERVANTWVVDKATRNGEDVTDEYSIFTLITSKDGDASLNLKYQFGNYSYNNSTNGTWEFNSNKQNLIFDYEDDDVDNVYRILRLKEDELWIRDIGGEDELQLKPA